MYANNLLVSAPSIKKYARKRKFFLFHGITYGGSDVIIVMAVDFCRHLLGKTLMNVMV